MSTVKIDLSEFNRLENYLGSKSNYNRNYYQHKTHKYVIYVESNDESWNEIYMMHGSDKVFLFECSDEECTNILEGELGLMMS